VVKESLKWLKDVVVINDGSEDSTEEEVKRTSAVLLVHPKRKGKGMALRTGFAYAQKRDFEAVLTLDGDGQHNPAEIPKFLRRAEGNNNWDIIIGSRMQGRNTMPFIRAWNNKFTSYLLSLLIGQRLEDIHSGYRLIKMSVLQNILLASQHYDLEIELLIKACRKNYKIVFIPIETIYGKEKSYFHPVIDSVRFFQVLFKNL
jgi:glycosyltransferase involved in cell wall biosynthesis